jgi:transposase InsO family protein
MMCRFYGVSRSGYYAWCKRDPSRRKRENSELVEVIKDEHDRSLGTYGSPRTTVALQQQGFSVSENRVARLMQANGIMARSATLYHANPGTHAFFTEIPNRIHRLEATGPNQIWAGDITYLRVGNKWRYLAVVMDLYSRRIIGWALGMNRKVDLTLRALNYAIRNRQPESGVYFHNDRGIEYAGLRYRRRLRQLGFIQSMNRPGKMIDNAQMESFFHSFKSDVYHGLVFRTETSIREVLRRYIPFYNQTRLHSGLGYVPPALYEAMAA